MTQPNPAHPPAGALAIVQNAAVVKPGERVAVIADERSRPVAEHFVAAVAAVGGCAELILIPLPHSHGVQPPEDKVAAIMKAHVALGATTFSLSHTPLRVGFCRCGGRFLSLADYDLEMLAGGGTLADFAATAPVVRRVATCLEQARTVHIRTRGGSDLRCVVAGRKAMAAPAYCPNPGDFGSPPDIEANITPIEDQTEGVLIVDGSIPLPSIGLVETPVVITIKRGRAVNVTGGREAVELKRVWDTAGNPAVRVAAELGLGLNRAARLCGRMLEDEGVYGTVHIGFGSNVTIGGKNAAPLHIDAVCRHATVRTDRQVIMEDGQLAPDLEARA